MSCQPVAGVMIILEWSCSCAAALTDVSTATAQTMDRTMRQSSARVRGDPAEQRRRGLDPQGSGVSDGRGSGWARGMDAGREGARVPCRRRVTAGRYGDSDADTPSDYGTRSLGWRRAHDVVLAAAQGGQVSHMRGRWCCGMACGPRARARPGARHRAPAARRRRRAPRTERGSPASGTCQQSSVATRYLRVFCVATALVRVSWAPFAQ